MCDQNIFAQSEIALAWNFETQKVVASSLENHISSLKEQKIQSKLFNFDSIDLEDIIKA